MTRSALSLFLLLLPAFPQDATTQGSSPPAALDVKPETTILIIKGSIGDQKTTPLLVLQDRNKLGKRQWGHLLWFGGVTVADYWTTKELFQKHPWGQEANAAMRCGDDICDGRYWLVSGATGGCLFLVERFAMPHLKRHRKDGSVTYTRGGKVLNFVLESVFAGRTAVAARNVYLLVR